MINPFIAELKYRNPYAHKHDIITSLCYVAVVFDTFNNELFASKNAMRKIKIMLNTGRGENICLLYFVFSNVEHFCRIHGNFQPGV